MFRLIKIIFIGLLTGIVSASNHTKFELLSNQNRMNQPTLINLHPNEYSQEFDYYPFAFKLNRCAGSCNTLNGLFTNKTEDLNLGVFKMFTELKKSKTLIKHLSCECK